MDIYLIQVLQVVEFLSFPWSNTSISLQLVGLCFLTLQFIVASLVVSYISLSQDLTSTMMFIISVNSCIHHALFTWTLLIVCSVTSKVQLIKASYSSSSTLQITCFCD
ncbi:uncharacterized protein M6B38_414105 [Iris pallida]|uniref:Uncharacterized protein n=1 Tax=Iris pallida TaxID=29817 RepID=A0AAX6FM57_IRIPA|nr:uncharacterized protein M6B38_414105 [Iris pallida]